MVVLDFYRKILRQLNLLPSIHTAVSPGGSVVSESLVGKILLVDWNRNKLHKLM